MPELPEVETIARTLAPGLTGRTVRACHLLNPGTLQGDAPLAGLVGRCFASPTRRGKLLLLPLVPDVLQPEGRGTEAMPDRSGRAEANRGDDGGKAAQAEALPELEQGSRAAACVFSPDALAGLAPETVIGLGVHLKMTGRVFVYPAETQPGPHTRAFFELDNGCRLFFDDARKFGYLRVLSPKDLASWPFWTRLGPEPLQISAADFVARFIQRASAIKALLLDQTVIAGCGNIYADESLFRAGIRPDVRGNELSAAHLERLRQALQEVLLESIDACGSSIRDYRTARGDAGAFQNAFRVYGRGKERCLVCKTPLQSCKVAGRSTVFCPRCQSRSSLKAKKT